MPHVPYSLRPMLNGQRMLLWSLQRHNPQCTHLVDQLEVEVKFAHILVHTDLFSDKKKSILNRDTFQ